jgi:diguanylate cyclase
MPSELDTLLRSPKAYDLVRKAVDAMEAHNVWPTARNFELWLHYIAERDGAVAAEIDNVIQAGKPFTEEVAEQIAVSHLPGAKLTGEILNAGQTLTKELDTVSKAIESARESSEAYGQQLASASQTLEGQDSEAFRSMVENLTAATSKVREENQALESQLADTTQELGRLREHLEQVRRDALTDALTGLANRKAFDEGLERACAEMLQQGLTLTLAVVDIDHFKSFNDTWGHQTGDQVIRYVASVIDRAAMAPRLSARYGGEEFAMIFPGETAEAALKVLETVREEVSSRILKRRSTNEELGAITISAGVAQREGDEPIASLIERADGALYASKNGGRNRVTRAEAPPPASRAAA